MREINKGWELLWITDILDKIGLKYWVIGGATLGIVREGHLLDHDNDIDIGVWKEDMNEEMIAKLKDKTPITRISSENEDKIIIGKREYKNFKIEIYLFFKEYDDACHKCHSPNEIPIYHCYPERFFDKSEKIEFLGKEINVPSPVEEYLTEEYGDWKKVIKDWDTSKDAFTIRSAKYKKVYIGGMFDLFHIGHVRLLKKAREYGNYIIIGLMTDEASKRWKRSPVIPYEQRLEIVKEFCEEVVPQEDANEIPLLEKIKPDVVMHGDDLVPFGAEWCKKNRKKMVSVPYTQEQSTTKIIKKIQNEDIT